MFVCISRFCLVEGDPAAVAQALKNRPREVDQVAGFRSMWAGQNSADPHEFVVEVRFVDVQSFDAWHRSPAFRLAHSAIPPGIKLDPSRTRLTTYELLSD
jgi:heme-degrading monooxygenase HmoA